MLGGIRTWEMLCSERAMFGRPSSSTGKRYGSSPIMPRLASVEGGDPVRGLVLAQRVCELTRNQAVPYLDTLAAAYAAAGQFSNAVATAQQAIDLARAARQPQIAMEIEPRLELYRSGRAYRQSVGVT